MQPDAPRILTKFDTALLSRFYPTSAEKHGVDGFVTVAATLDTAGQATDVRILSESPPDMGFGAAASSLAYSLSYSNPTGADRKSVV